MGVGGTSGALDFFTGVLLAAAFFAAAWCAFGFLAAVVLAAAFLAAGFLTAASFAGAADSSTGSSAGAGSDEVRRVTTFVTAEAAWPASDFAEARGIAGTFLNRSSWLGRHNGGRKISAHPGARQSPTPSGESSMICCHEPGHPQRQLGRSPQGDRPSR